MILLFLLQFALYLENQTVPKLGLGMQHLQREGKTAETSQTTDSPAHYRVFETRCPIGENAKKHLNCEVNYYMTGWTVMIVVAHESQYHHKIDDAE